MDKLRMRIKAKKVEIGISTDAYCVEHFDESTGTFDFMCHFICDKTEHHIYMDKKRMRKFLGYCVHFYMKMKKQLESGIPIKVI